MNERILNLLSLCMQAMEDGYNVKLEVYSGLTDKKQIDLWHFARDNGQLYIVKNLCVIDDAEAYIKELIKWQAQD